MTATDPPDVVEGGCHCGRVRFCARLATWEALSCNCSICTMKGFLHVIVPAAVFELVAGQDSLSTYTFNTGTAKHTFCRVCGVHPFYRPRSHPDGVDVNVRCLDGALPARFSIRPFDGANWEENVDAIRGGPGFS